MRTNSIRTPTHYLTGADRQSRVFHIVLHQLPKQISALERGYVWSQYSGSNPTSKKGVHTIYNECICANNFIKHDLKSVVILDYNKPNNTIDQLTLMALDIHYWRHIVRRVVLQK